MGNRLRLLGAVAAAGLLLAGCGPVAERGTADSGVWVENLNVDNYFVKGTVKQYFPEAPKRIMVVGENETETLLALGAKDKILMAFAQNKRKYAMREENARLFEQVPRTDSAYLNMEYITELQPDLIVAQQCIFIKNRLKNTKYWNDLGIRTLLPLNTNSPGKHIHPETMDQELQFILDLGRALRLEKNAEAIVASTYKTRDDILQAVAGEKKPRVMIVEFMSQMVCYDRTKLVGNMVESIGGIVSENPPVIGMENIIKENPEVLFLVCSHVDYGECIGKITENPALQHLPCVKNKRVYSVPLRFTYGAQVRTEDGLRYLAERMYPQVKFAPAGG